MPNPDSPIAWMDREDIGEVVFHPRSESFFDARPTQGTELAIPVSSNITVGARFYPAGKADPVILFFHGNGEVVADYDTVAAFYTQRRVNFLPVDYRGYGKSKGVPTVTTMLQDAGTIFDFARKWLADRGHTGPLLVMGRSLGSASAMEIVSRRPDQVAGLIIDSGFAHVIPLLQVLGARLSAGDLRQRDILDQSGKIRSYKGPVLIIHGARDQIIPVRDAEDLLAASGSTSKVLLKIPDGDHNNLLLVGRNAYMAAVSTLVKEVTK
jgi:hypothetical protein